MQFLNKALALLRLKPTLAWSGAAILLALSLAVHLNYPLYFHFILAAIMVVVAQSFLAHSVNDLADYEVDKKAKITETGRSRKLLVTGELTKWQMEYIAFISCFVYLILGCYLFTKLGWPIAIFMLIGLYTIFGYSCSPLKLGWRPFAEWTVVFPLLITLVIALFFVATKGTFDTRIIRPAIGFALLNVASFTISRFVDLNVDMDKGKKTTPIWWIEKKREGGWVIAWLHGIVFVLISMIFVSTLVHFAICLPLALVGSFIIWNYIGDVMWYGFPNTIEAIGRCRTYFFYYVFLSIVLISGWFVWSG